MFKCQVLWKLFVFILSRRRSLFYDRWCHPVFLLIPCIFAVTAANMKSTPFVSLRDPTQQNSGKGSKRFFFLLVVWHRQLFHLYRSNCNLNCFLIHRYIYFPGFFLAVVFVSLQTHQYNTDFKIHLWKREGKYAFCKNWVNIHIYKSILLFAVSISARNDKQKQCDQHCTFHFFR